MYGGRQFFGRRDLLLGLHGGERRPRQTVDVRDAARHFLVDADAALVVEAVELLSSGRLNKWNVKKKEKETRDTRVYLIRIGQDQTGIDQPLGSLGQGIGSRNEDGGQRFAAQNFLLLVDGFGTGRRHNEDCLVSTKRKTNSFTVACSSAGWFNKTHRRNSAARRPCAPTWNRPPG